MQKEATFFSSIPAVSLSRFIIFYCDPMVCVAFAVMWLPVRLPRMQVQSIFTTLFTIYTVKTMRSAVRVRKRRTNVSILKIWNDILLCLLLYYRGLYVRTFASFAGRPLLSLILPAFVPSRFQLPNFSVSIQAAHNSNIIVDLTLKDCPHWQSHE